MAEIFDWELDTGASTGSPAKGTTRNTGLTDNNWKNIDDAASLYSSYPILGGNNSFQRNLFAKITGTFDSILNPLFAHTAGSLPTGVTLKGIPSCTGDASRYLYVTPSTTADSNLTTDMTAAISISSGVSVCVGPTGPEAAGKASSGTANPLYTNYLTTQIQTTSAAPEGDTATQTMTLQYQVN